MKKKIIVNIGYMHFNFNNIDQAVDFAEKAATTLDKSDREREVNIEVTFIDDDDKEEQ